MTIREYNQELKYLPDFMRDFHDQKDLFKCIQDWAQRNEDFDKLPNSWMDNHIFCIDYFLWFMSLHGYKLQQIRTNILVHDLSKSIAEFREKSIKSLASILQQK